MINIFHGDNPTASREACLNAISVAELGSVLQIDSKNIDLNQITNFLSSGTLFEDRHTLVINNFFSISKANIDKVIKQINNNKCDVIIWQDKALNATQLKTFPKANVQLFKADNKIFSCLNAIKPHNLNQFISLYDQIISQDLFDLFLYFLKNNLRRQLQGYGKFDQIQIKKTYLQIIELEYQYKTGQLSLPKDLALKRVLTPILK